LDQREKKRRNAVSPPSVGSLPIKEKAISSVYVYEKRNVDPSQAERGYKAERKGTL
jgi:hypothetical protein